MKFSLLRRLPRARVRRAFAVSSLTCCLVLQILIEPCAAESLSDSGAPANAAQSTIGEAATPSWGPSELDYLDTQVPIVLSVSRLPQRLDETPGSVTIIDRQMIRASGARDVADLLRLVPGFGISNSFQSTAPVASYHSRADGYANRVQLMVDGRSVYSTYLLGGIGPGLQTVALEDIERIEVYRGSNSAAYGARAFLGSINIVTRDLVDTQGVSARLSQGVGRHGAGVTDWGVILGGDGWGAADVGASSLQERSPLSWRLSTDSRRDDNLVRLPDRGGPVKVERVNLRGDLRLGPEDVIEFRAGQHRMVAGMGYSDEQKDPLRDRVMVTQHVQLDWRKSLSADADLSLQASHTDESMRDFSRVTPCTNPNPARCVPEGIVLDLSGRARSSNLMAQHTVRLSPGLRWVWGGELRREEIRARPITGTGHPFVTDFARLFANAEWRFAPDWLLNAGALYEWVDLDAPVGLGGGAGHGFEQGEWAPRLMLNWQVSSGNTLRAGVSRAFRPPSMFERNANIRYACPAGTSACTEGETFAVYQIARGNAASEWVDARELGWLFEAGPAGTVFSTDWRLFRETVRDGIIPYNYLWTGPEASAAQVGGVPTAIDYINGPDYTLRGYEAQFRLRPWNGAQLHYAYTRFSSEEWVGIGVEQAWRKRPVPDHRSQSLMFMQRMPWGLDASVMAYAIGPRVYPGNTLYAEPYSRIDLRLAKTLQRRVQMALTLQNIDGDDADYNDFLYFQRRIFITLRVEQ
ncbi:TonB-dependent receptor [Leptospira sp. 96542]|nr:TonB-dependent receptor [Leptospira sp. 96542]